MNPDKEGVIGVAMGWSGKPQLCFEDDIVMISSKVDRLLFPQYFIKGQAWPVDPETKEKLPLVRQEEQWFEGKKHGSWKTRLKLLFTK